MVATLTYRTADNTRWGGGLGSDLSAVLIDLNFWNLFTALDDLEASQVTTVSIDFITQSGGNQLFVHLTNHAVLGPFTIPTSQWNPRGEWQPSTAYAPFDTVSNNGALYLVTVGHISAATFNPFATDGLGHLLYVLILSAPNSVLPDGGEVGQRLVRQGGSPVNTAWEYDVVRLATFIEGQPTPSQLLMQYVVVDVMTLPANLIGSGFFNQIPPSTITTYNLFKNGASIGSITFSASPETIVANFAADIDCVPEDVITLVGPTTPDVTHSGISFTIVALITE